MNIKIESDYQDIKKKELYTYVKKIKYLDLHKTILRRLDNFFNLFNINCVQDLININPEKIYKTKNLGKVTYEYIVDLLYIIEEDGKYFLKYTHEDYEKNFKSFYYMK